MTLRRLIGEVTGPVRYYRQSEVPLTGSRNGVRQTATRMRLKEKKGTSDIASTFKGQRKARVLGTHRKQKAASVDNGETRVARHAELLAIANSGDDFCAPPPVPKPKSSLHAPYRVELVCVD
jgi:hypothetical protein